MHERIVEQFFLPVGAFGQKGGVLELFHFAPALHGGTEVIPFGIFRKRHGLEELGKLLHAGITFV